MIGDMRSHQTLAEVRTQLRGPIFVVGHGTESAGAGPGLGEVSVEIDQFQHLGHRGHLQLAFANGRLYQAVFSPSTPGEYFASVEVLTGAIRPAAGEVWFDPSTRVHLVLINGQGRSVAWEDECIGEEIAVRRDHHPTR